MTAFYSNEDVLRWENRALETIQIQREALRKPGITADLRRQRVGHVAGAYRSLAMVKIALGRFEEAVAFLRKFLEMEFESYEIVLAQHGTVSAGDFQLVLLAFATNEHSLIKKMVGYYQWQNGVPESVFLGRIVKSLAVADIQTAQDALAEKPPGLEKLFAAYPDCLQAIANRDQVAFNAAISVASKNWGKWVSKHERGLPDAVCFIQGVGLIRLADHVLGQTLEIRDENIPAELIR